MGILKDKVIFCQECRAFHRKSYDCSMKTSNKKAEVVQNLAEPILNETEASVASPIEEVTLVAVEPDELELVETVLEAVDDGTIMPLENQEILKDLSQTAKKKRAKKESE
jgi:hypothetical protein